MRGIFPISGIPYVRDGDGLSIGVDGVRGGSSSEELDVVLFLFRSLIMSFCPFLTSDICCACNNMMMDTNGGRGGEGGGGVYTLLHPSVLS